MTTLAQAEEYQNDTVHVTVRRHAACRAELEVRAGLGLISKARRGAVKSVNKNVTLPGFRKGKAPEETILKKFGPQVEKEMHQQLADLAFAEAQRLARVPLLNNNASISFQMKRFTEAEAELSFLFETEPFVPTVDPTQFVKKPIERADLSTKELDEAVRQMQYFYAEWKPIDDRPIQDGDAILIDLETKEADGTYQKVFDHIRFEVSKARMAAWMKKLVEGAKAGDVLEGISEADESATEEEKKEITPKPVRLTIHKVEQAILPELDDEFAKKVGAADVHAMRQSIAQLLNSRLDEKVINDLREQVNDFLIDKYAFDLPYSLVDTEKKHRLQQLMQNPKFKASWDNSTPEEKQKVEADLDLESTQAVRLFYLSRKIVNDAQIPITNKEVQDESIVTLQSFGVRNIDKIPKEVYALALSKVILAKAQDYVLSFTQSS